MKKTILFSSALAFACMAVAQIPQNGLIAHFTLNGSAGFTSMVHGNTISPQNYTTDSRSGGQTKPGNSPDRYNLTDSAGSFEFTSYQYLLEDVSSTKNSKLKVKKEITFGGWYMLNGYDNYNLSPLMFGAWGPTYGSYGFQGNINNGNIYMVMSSNTSNNQLLGINISSDGSQAIDYYRHVMGTLSSDDTMRFYFQGKLVGKRLFVGDSIQYFDYSNGKKYFSMGAQFTSNGWNGTGFKGSADDILVYDRALSAAEIWTLFNNNSKCTNSNAVKPGHLLRNATNQISVADSTTWHRDKCDFEWYANGNYGLTTSKSSGATISITQNATYKVKVIHKATRCWYWTNDIVVTNLAGGTNGVSNIDQGLVSVWPNPVSNILNISSDQKVISIKVISSDGREIISSNQNVENQISTELWNTGVYFVTVQTERGISTRKILKN